MHRHAKIQRTPALHAVPLKGTLPSRSPSPSPSPSRSPSPLLALHSHYSPSAHSHTEHHRFILLLRAPTNPPPHAVLQQPTDEPYGSEPCHARRHGHGRYGHRCESRYDGSEPDAGHERYGHAGDGQLWAGLEEPCRLISGPCELVLTGRAGL